MAVGVSPTVFYVGLHQPADASRFERCCISIRRLWGRKKKVICPDVLVDSAAFTELALHGLYRSSVDDYARELMRLHESQIVQIRAAISQDYMCEPFMLAKTGLTVAEHQRLTIERFDALSTWGLPFEVMPVLQGFQPADYLSHLRSYGARLAPGMWVGVGSVCKRNGDPESVVAVLDAIKRARPDLRLHGFGVKITSLAHPGVRGLLWSADSMAWSLAARRQGRDGNAWREAKAFADRIAAIAEREPEPWQPRLMLEGVAA